MTVRDARWISNVCNLVLWFCIAVLFAVGCAEHRHARFSIATVPKRCLHEVKIDDFRKPCRPVEGKPDEALCDDVHIWFHCVDYPE